MVTHNTHGAGTSGRNRVYVDVHWQRVRSLMRGERKQRPFTEIGRNRSNLFRHSEDADREESGSFALTASGQLVLASRTRTLTPRHQITGVRCGNGRFRVPRSFPHQHPCKHRHSPPEGGMRNKRMH
jgi:hypothetical protein